LSFVRLGELRIMRAWFRVATRWLDSIRPGVMSPFLDGGLMPDASGVTTSHLNWADMITAGVMPHVRRQAQIPWSAVTGGNEDDFAQDPDMLAYLDDAHNRMVRTPDEVYAQINTIIHRGIDEGLSIPEIADDVSTVLTANQTEQWRNRAVTVARTETIGATNAGAFYGAADLARERQDPNPEKIWIATVGDGRTRETHQIADKQRVPLFEPFTVGGFSLMFPGDPSGPAHEVINCRCSILDVVAGEEVDWTDRQFLDQDPWADSEDWQAPEFRIGD
jgi:hypothetical protein